MIELLYANLPWLVTMLILIGLSGFFSGSEAALFYLSLPTRRAMAAGRGPQRLAVRLLDQPDRLLSAVLFWNLLINISYFGIVSVVSLRLRNDGVGESVVLVFSVVAVFLVIFFSEMAPKTIAVLSAARIAALVAVPLSASVRVVDPLMPMLRLIYTVSRRLLLPRFRAEPYLNLNDLHRALDVSKTDAALLEQEQTVLTNIVSLSMVRVEELMRPRMQFLSFRPPVRLADLEGKMTRSGYILVTEPDSDEVTGAISLRTLTGVPKGRIDHRAEDVVVLPWCAAAADALESLRQKRRRVATIVNELGETIGILTLEDLLDTIFSDTPSRSGRLLKRRPVEKVGVNRWQAPGMTSLKYLARHFGLPPEVNHDIESVTIAGFAQERLARLPRRGDRCRWGPLEITVLEATGRGAKLLELGWVDEQEEQA